jgi:hypothetical protein
MEEYRPVIRGTVVSPGDLEIEVARIKCTGELHAVAGLDPVPASGFGTHDASRAVRNPRNEFGRVDPRLDNEVCDARRIDSELGEAREFFVPLINPAVECEWSDCNNARDALDELQLFGR